ncbi:MAG: hypothetical protein AAFR79_00465 [Pseudomonadota bacterium]
MLEGDTRDSATVMRALEAVDRLPEVQLSAALSILSALKDSDHVGVERLFLHAIRRQGRQPNETDTRLLADIRERQA